MNLLLAGFHSHVVHVYIKCFSNLLLKVLVHRPLIRRASSLQSEWHNVVLVLCMLGHKRCRYPDGPEHGYLIVFRIGAHERE